MYQFIASPLMTVKVETPKRIARTRRIQKKWNKRYGMNTIYKPMDSVYLMGDRIIAHPEVVRQMKQALESTMDRELSGVFGLSSGPSSSSLTKDVFLNMMRDWM